MQVDPYRREYVLGQAVAAGKFPQDRVGHYRALYDRDPVGTEHVLATLASITTPASPYPRDLFPELDQAHNLSSRADVEVAAGFLPPVVARPTSAPAAVATEAEQIAAWTRELFPEVVAAGAAPRRITWAND